MLNLAFDTSTSHGSVVLYQDQTLLFEKTWLREKSHSEMLTKAIEEAFSTALKTPKDLTQICLAHGPGSFTGIRVAVNVARSFAYALNLEVYGFDSLDLLALGVDPTKSPQDHLICMIDAYNNEIFCAQYKKINSAWKKTSVSQSYTLKALQSFLTGPHLCIGEAYKHYEPHFSSEIRNCLVRDVQFEDHPQAKNLKPSSLFSQALAWNQVQALYIKASAAEEKLKQTI